MKRTMSIGLVMGLVASAAAAQNPPAAKPQAAPPPAQTQQPQMPMAMPGMRGQGMRAPMDRAQMEQQIRNRIGTQLKNQLKLTDDQFTKLQATNKKFEERRRLLMAQERDARMGMRDLLIAGDTANQGKVSAALDRMLQIQRERFDLVEQEQKELAGYLTPMQRARFLGVQEQMRMRIERLRMQGAGRGPGAGMMNARPMGFGAGTGMGRGMARGAAAFRAGAAMRQRQLWQGTRRPPNGPPAVAQPPVPPEATTR